MCDYSLHTVASRPAEVGDKLVTTGFANTISQGFCGVGKPNVAVCLMPGTELAFEKDTVYWHPLAQVFPRLRFRTRGATVARFRQIKLNDPKTHHDALEFANGRIVLLTKLCPGQRATVLQLPAQPQATTKESVERSRSLITS
jgi:hypothetical protein